MKRLALALLSFILPLSAQKTFVEVPENMVRTEPITENLAIAKRMVSRHRQREFIWAALRKEKKPCRASLPKSPTVRSASRKTRPASPPSPPRSKNRQEPSWARMTPA